VSEKPRGLLVSERFLARSGGALDAASREAGLALERIVVPDDPESRVDASACARIELAYFSGDLFPERSRAFFAAALAAPELRWLQVFNAGVDHPVFQRFVEKGVRLTTAAGSSAEPIAQTAFAGLLMLARGFPHWLDAQARRAWEPAPRANAPADLRGQTLVVFGLGAIGSEIARLARAFGMRVIGVRRSPAAGGEPVDELHPPDRLRDLLPSADWLALACALTDETRGAIDEAALALLPKGARVLNVARGGVVDEPALIAALEAGKIAGAGLDVFSQEPLPRDNPLWKTKNVTIFSHLGGYSQGYEDRAMPTIAGNMGKFLAGDLKSMINIVRKPASWKD
jgi:phosphoglycerate dehydrogenase-like enzyme